jgi:hypothetical protein
MISNSAWTFYEKSLGLARTIHLQVYTVYIRYQTYSHLRCIYYTVLANPRNHRISKSAHTSQTTHNVPATPWPRVPEGQSLL